MAPSECRYYRDCACFSNTIWRIRKKMQFNLLFNHRAGSKRFLGVILSWVNKRSFFVVILINILQRQFKVADPNRVWVSDITCFKVNGKYFYICVILDLFSRTVVAHRVSPKNSAYPGYLYISSGISEQKRAPATDASQRPGPAICIQHIPETTSHGQGCPVFLEVRPSS